MQISCFFSKLIHNCGRAVKRTNEDGGTEYDQIRQK